MAALSSTGPLRVQFLYPDSLIYMRRINRKKPGWILYVQEHVVGGQLKICRDSSVTMRDMHGPRRLDVGTDPEHGTDDVRVGWCNLNLLNSSIHVLAHPVDDMSLQ